MQASCHAAVQHDHNDVMIVHDIVKRRDTHDTHDTQNATIAPQSGRTVGWSAGNDAKCR